MERGHRPLRRSRRSPLTVERVPGLRRWPPSVLFLEGLEPTPGVVQEKYSINANTFPFGYITTYNSWINYWREGQNSTLDWRGASDRGFGAKSLGAEVAATRAFSVCQVEKVFEQVCFRPVGSPADRAAVERIAG